ncbi:MAG: hypothetical protein WAT79_03330, partial [Saprospiraceae bacterium]
EFKVGGNSNNPLGFLGPLLILTIFFAILYFFFKGLFYVLNIIAPVLLILTLFLDYTVVKDFFTFLWRLFKDNPLLGILAGVLLFFGYPFVSGYLFLKAILRRGIKKKIDSIHKEKNTYSEYEEVVEKEDDFLELPPLQQKPKNDNPYDEVF